MNKSKQIKFDVRCSQEELRLIGARANQQNLSRSRYLVEAGLNVKGIADWQERSRREYGIFKLVSLTNALQDSLGQKRFPEQAQLIAQIQELQESVNSLLRFYETNELVERPSLINKPNHSKVMRNYLSDYYSSNSDEQSQKN